MTKRYNEVTRPNGEKVFLEVDEEMVRRKHTLSYDYMEMDALGKLQPAKTMDEVMSAFEKMNTSGDKNE